MRMAVTLMRRFNINSGGNIRLFALAFRTGSLSLSRARARSLSISLSHAHSCDTYLIKRTHRYNPATRSVSWRRPSEIPSEVQPVHDQEPLEGNGEQIQGSGERLGEQLAGCGEGGDTVGILQIPGAHGEEPVEGCGEQDASEVGREQSPNLYYEITNFGNLYIRLYGIGGAHEEEPVQEEEGVEKKEGWDGGSTEVGMAVLLQEESEISRGREAEMDSSEEVCA